MQDVKLNQRNIRIAADYEEKIMCYNTGPMATALCMGDIEDTSYALALFLKACSLKFRHGYSVPYKLIIIGEPKDEIYSTE